MLEPEVGIQSIWAFPKNRGVFPPNHPLKNRDFHYKSSILGYPYFRKQPYTYLLVEKVNKDTYISWKNTKNLRWFHAFWTTFFWTTSIPLLQTWHQMFIMVVLMVQKSGKHQLSLVLYLPLYLQKVLNISIYPWWFSYFWTINSIMSSGWWYQTFFSFTPTWGRFPFWLIFFRRVGSTTNQSSVFLEPGFHPVDFLDRVVDVRRLIRSEACVEIQVLGWPVVGLWSDPNYDAFGEPGKNLGRSWGDPSGLLGVVKVVYFWMFPQK